MLHPVSWMIFYNFMCCLKIGCPNQLQLNPISMNQNKQPAVLATSHSKHWSRWLLWLTALVIIIAPLVYYFGYRVQKDKSRGDKQKSPPISVALATARLGDMPVYLNGLGTVTALKTVTVHSRVDGELIHVAFTEGQSVHKGDLLAEIDSRPFRVLLKQAQGQLIRDQALLKNAQLDLTRYTTLQKQDSIAAQQTATQAALVKQYQGIVEVDQSQVDNANLQLTYARITAPINGRIGLRLVDQGNIVHASDSSGMVVITQTEPISVIFTLPEDAVPSVMERWHTNQSIDVEAFDRSGNHKLANGKVLAVDNQIDATTGTLKLKAQFENEKRTLFPNQFVNIKMHLNTLTATTLVPTAAIQRGMDGAFVYAVDKDNKIMVKPIKTGDVNGETIAVVEGLAANEKLVVDGADKLREGSQVNVVKLNNIPVKSATAPDGHHPKKGKHSSQS